MLSTNLLSQWFLLRETMKIKFTVPRYYFSPYLINEVNNVNLNGFRHVSKKGYVAVIYINGRTPNNEYISSIVICKTKMDPVKTLKLEFLACLLLSQLMNKVLMRLQGIVEIYNSTCCSDSLDAIHRIKGLDKKCSRLFREGLKKFG